MIVPLSVVVLTFNEEANLPACLASLSGWVEELYIVDSGSTDRTLEIARQYGATIVTHPFERHTQQWQWAIDHLPLQSEWVLGLDADQRVTPDLRDEMISLFSPVSLPSPASSMGSQRGAVNPLATSDLPYLEAIDALFIKRRQIFRGTWIRHGTYYPKYLLKAFRRTKVIFDERDRMDHHFYVNGKSLKLQHDLIEDNQKEYDLTFWIAKHNRYALLHAEEEWLRLKDTKSWLIQPRLFGNPDERVAWLKTLWYRLPLFVRPALYFIYRYLFRLGFLDGKQGFIFHFLQGFWYRLLVDIHLDEIRQGGVQRRVDDW